MAITQKWIGHTTTTTSRIGARSDADGDITLTVNGTPYTETAATATNDGIVVFNVTGLDPGRRYTATFNDGSTVSIPTLPETGPYRIGVVSCLRPDRPATALFKLAQEEPHLVFFVGDMWYDGEPYTQGGETFVGTSTSLANSQDIANYYTGHRQGRNIAGVKYLMENFPFYYMPDDHERGWNDAVYLLASFQANVTGAGSATQEQFETARDNGLTAGRAWMQTNPDAPDTGDDQPLYFSLRLPDGSAECWVTDLITYRSSITAADNSSKTMLGANQKAWLKDGVKDSTATNKLVISPKQYWKGGTNSDTWANKDGTNPGYQTELKEILLYWADTVGVSTHAGDQHSPNVQYVGAEVLGEGYPAHLCVVACPINKDVFSHSASIGSEVVMAYGGITGTRDMPSNQQVAVYELITVQSDRISAKMVSTVKGVVWEGEVLASGNEASNPRAGRLAIA